MIYRLKKITVIIGSLLALGSCQNRNKQNQEHQQEDNSKNKENTQKNQESHKGTTYQYVNSTATSTQIKYDYEVQGTDEEGKEVQGNINIEGTNGEGELIKDNAVKVEIVVEWIGKGKLVATDAEGNEYKLRIE